MLTSVALFPGAAGAAVVQGKTENSVFFEDAAQYYRWRAENAGARNLYLNALADASTFEKYSLDWYPGLREPRHFLRIGIGFSYNKKDYEGSLLTLGAAPDASALSTGRSAAAAADGFPTDPRAGQGSGVDTKYKEPIPGDNPKLFMTSYGGQLADDLVAELYKRRDRPNGGFGKVLSAVEGLGSSYPALVIENAAAADPAAPAGGSSAGGRGGRLGGQMAAPGRGGDDQSGGGQRTDAGGGDAASEGDPDSEDSGTSEGADDSASESSPASRLKRPDEPYSSVHAGLVCLNEAKLPELTKRGRELGLDVMFVFDISVKEAKGQYFSTTILRLIDLRTADKEIVAQSKNLRHDTNQNDRDPKTNRNALETELDKILVEFDQLYLGQPLPAALTEQHVVKRIDRLMADFSVKDRLTIAVEVMGFFRKGLLPEDKTVAVLDRLFEGGGKILVSGSREDRLAFVRKIGEEMESGN